MYSNMLDSWEYMLSEIWHRISAQYSTVRCRKYFRIL